MSLFQNAVLNKYLQGLELEKVAEAYERFTKPKVALSLPEEVARMPYFHEQKEKAQTL